MIDQKASNDNRMEVAIYANAVGVWPRSNSVIASCEKAENVVSEPRKPTIMNALVGSVKFELSKT